MFKKRDRKSTLLKKAKKIEERYNNKEKTFTRKDIQVLFELLGIQFEELNNMIVQELTEAMTRLDKQEIDHDKKL